jgi:hypothetical protein
MMMILGASIALALALISAIHVYWAAGGRWGIASVLPQRPGGAGDRAFTPSATMTVAVALALAGAAALVTMRSGLLVWTGVPTRYLTRSKREAFRFSA